jgi:MinD-like ATPase involved in chromosome partitioning or flagellar assembly
MAKIISIHSFRGGTGKSNIVANIATLLAVRGKRVGVIDTDIQSPGIHVLFGLIGREVTHSLNDFLWGMCDIQQVAIDVTSQLSKEISGKLLLIPSSIKTGDITQVLREGYDTQLLATGIRTLIKKLDLDMLMIDTHPGLDEETLMSLVLSHTLVILMRPDQQDYEGTGVTIEVARNLDVPRMMLVMNNVPAAFDTAEVKAKVKQTYHCEVGAVLPHSEEMVALASAGIFALQYPDRPLTKMLEELTSKLLM